MSFATLHQRLSIVDYFKNLFNKLVKFIKNKIFGKDKEREDYWKVPKDMDEHGIFSDDTIESIKDDYAWNIRKMINIKIKVMMTLKYRLEVL